uniref:Lipocalin/cytosolic fatty-acid binding domain-containing protein n=1 Tax=Callithrix jacchus TaxID=9483 RepID=F7A954_CALJA
ELCQGVNKSLSARGWFEPTGQSCANRSYARVWTSLLVPGAGRHLCAQPFPAVSAWSGVGDSHIPQEALGATDGHCLWRSLRFPESRGAPVPGHRENNNCVEKKVLAEKTENSRNFKINFMAVNEVTLLQTDYDKFLFLCMKSTAAPNQSTMCQYLARSEEADNEVMNEFFRVVLTVPVDSRMLMGWHRLPEPCPV